MRGDGRHPREYRDQELQNRILDTMLGEIGAVTITQLSEVLAVHPAIVVGNLGELQSKEQVRCTKGGGRNLYEITPTGIARARGPLPD